MMNYSYSTQEKQRILFYNAIFAVKKNLLIYYQNKNKKFFMWKLKDLYVFFIIKCFSDNTEAPLPSTQTEESFLRQHFLFLVVSFQLYSTSCWGQQMAHWGKPEKGKVTVWLHPQISAVKSLSKIFCHNYRNKKLMNMWAHLDGHLRELLSGFSDDVSQSEDGTQQVVSSLAAPQVGVVHLWEDVPPGKQNIHRKFRFTEDMKSCNI